MKLVQDVQKAWRTTAPPQKTQELGSLDAKYKLTRVIEYICTVQYRHRVYSKS